MEGTNITNGTKRINTIVNYDFEIDSKSGLAMQSSVETKLETSADPEKYVDRTNKVVMTLTDHDSEYFTIKGEFDELGAKNVGASNAIKMGEGKAGVEYSVDRDLNSMVGLKASGYRFGETGVRIKNNVSNEELVREAYVKSEISKDLNLSFQSSYSNITKTSVSVGVEKRIQDNETMVITVNHDQVQGYSLMYQMSMKFN